MVDYHPFSLVLDFKYNDLSGGEKEKNLVNGNDYLDHSKEEQNNIQQENKICSNNIK